MANHKFVRTIGKLAPTVDKLGLSLPVLLKRRGGIFMTSRFEGGGVWPKVTSLVKDGHSPMLMCHKKRRWSKTVRRVNFSVDIINDAPLANVR